MDPKTPSTSFNLILDSEIAKKIREVQEHVSALVKDLRNYDNSPHLAILTKFMRPPTTEIWAQALVREFGSDKSWELEFGNFSLSPVNTQRNTQYVFLNLSPASRDTLYSMHQRACAASDGIGSLGQDEPDPKYPYDPHVSIIKLSPEEAPRILTAIEHDLSGLKMVVRELEVTRQETDPDGFSVFPIIATIRLL